MKEPNSILFQLFMCLTKKNNKTEFSKKQTRFRGQVKQKLGDTLDVVLSKLKFQIIVMLMQNRDQLSIRGKINNRFILFLAIIFSDIVKSSKNDRLTTQFHYVRLKQHNTTYVKRSPLSAKMRGFNDKSHFHSHGKSWRSVDRGRH